MQNFAHSRQRFRIIFSILYQIFRNTFYSFQYKISYIRPLVRHFCKVSGISLQVIMMSWAFTSDKQRQDYSFQVIGISYSTTSSFILISNIRCKYLLYNLEQRQTGKDRPSLVNPSMVLTFHQEVVLQLMHQPSNYQLFPKISAFPSWNLPTNLEYKLGKI